MGHRRGGVVVLALILHGELEQGTADWFTYLYLVWMGAWTAIDLLVWAARRRTSA